MKDFEVVFQIMSIYRQIHVLKGGIAGFNEYLLKTLAPLLEHGEEQIFALMKKYACGERLVHHYKKLASGQINAKTMELEDRPYRDAIPLEGEAETKMYTPLSVAPKEEAIPQNRDMLFNAIMNFGDFTEQNLKNFKLVPAVAQLGNAWTTQISALILADHSLEQPLVMKKFNDIVEFNLVLKLWYDAQKILESQPLDASMQTLLDQEMVQFERYLPRFGDEGSHLIASLKALRGDQG